MTYSYFSNRKLFKDQQRAYVENRHGQGYICETIIIRQTIINQQSINIGLNWYTSNGKRDPQTRPACIAPGDAIKAGTSLFSKCDRSCPRPMSEQDDFLWSVGERERLRSNYLNTSGPARWRPAFNQRLHIVNRVPFHSVCCHICLALLFFLEQERIGDVIILCPIDLIIRFPQSSNTASAYSTSK